MLFDDDDPLYGILASTMFSLHVMVHTITQYTQAQLVFRGDSILNLLHKAKHLIEKRKQDLINKGNQQENCNQKITRTSNGTKSDLKMHEKQNLIRMYIRDPILSQLSEIMTLLGPAKVKLQTPSTFATLLRMRNKCSSIMV